MGLNHNWRPMAGAYRPFRACLDGSFDCNGASDPVDVRDDLLDLFDIVRTSAGLFTLTWKNGKYPPKIVRASASFLGDFTEGDQVAVVSADDAAATITITTKDGTGVTDIPAGENVRIQLELVVALKKLSR